MGLVGVLSLMPGTLHAQMVCSRAEGSSTGCLIPVKAEFWGSTGDSCGSSPLLPSRPHATEAEACNEVQVAVGRDWVWFSEILETVELS